MLTTKKCHYLLHLQEAADNHVSYLVKAGILEEQKKGTDWCTGGMFLPKVGRPD